MRTIHSARKSRFLRRRSLYEYWPARMTACLAILYTLPRRPRKPFDFSRTFLCRARAVTPRLTLGMVVSLTRKEALTEYDRDPMDAQPYYRAGAACAWSTSW